MSRRNGGHPGGKDAIDELSDEELQVIVLKGLNTLADRWGRSVDDVCWELYADLRQAVIEGELADDDQ